MARAKAIDDIAEAIEENVAAEEEELEEVYFPPVKSRDEENFVIVGFNGEFIKIKKGERVKVKKGFANVIRLAEAQERVNAENMLKANS